MSVLSRCINSRNFSISLRPHLQPPVGPTNGTSSYLTRYFIRASPTAYPKTAFMGNGGKRTAPTAYPSVGPYPKFLGKIKNPYFGSNDPYIGRTTQFLGNVPCQQIGMREPSRPRHRHPRRFARWFRPPNRDPGHQSAALARFTVPARIARILLLELVTSHLSSTSFAPLLGLLHELDLLLAGAQPRGNLRGRLRPRKLGRRYAGRKGTVGGGQVGVWRRMNWEGQGRNWGWRKRKKREEKRHPTDMWGPTYNSF
jgi:hypothetical protein